MNTLHRLDDQILTAVNGFARHTGWLHGVVSGYADYGVVLFAVMLLAVLWLNRTRDNRAPAPAPAPAVRESTVAEVSEA